MQKVFDITRIAVDGSRQRKVYDESGNNDDLGIAPVETVILGNRQFGDIRFQFKRHRAGTAQMTADIVMTRQGKKYVGPDAAIHSVKGDYTFFRPGQSDHPYDFYLAPDGKSVYVDRGVCAGYVAGYVYNIADGKLSPVLFNGLWLYEFFPLEFLRRTKQLSLRRYMENNLCRFERWLPKPGGGYLLQANLHIRLLRNEGPGLKNAKRNVPPPEFTAYAVFDLDRAKLVALHDVTKQELQRVGVRQVKKIVCRRCVGTWLLRGRNAT